MPNPRENEKHSPLPPSYLEAEGSAQKNTASNPGNIVIIGGQGKVAFSLAQLLVKHAFTVTSVVSKDSQTPDIKGIGATPYVLSLEDAAALTTLTVLFTEANAQLIYVATGEGDKSGSESVHKVAYKHALKVFDAVEAIPREKKPRVILVSSIDTRNPDNLEAFPPHYNDVDKELSGKYHDAMKPYFKWRYKVDKNLVARTAFDWTILRPGELIDGPGKGRVEIGRTHLKDITRDDVAMTLFQLASRPTANAQALDVVSGGTPVADALDLAIKKLKGKLDFLD